MSFAMPITRNDYFQYSSFMHSQANMFIEGAPARGAIHLERH